MTDLDRLRAERADLDRRIREAEAETVGTFNFDLDRLCDSAYGHARQNSIPWTDSARKNWTTLVLAERVWVNFGEYDGERAGGLTVISGGMTAEFDPLPTAGELTGLIDFLLAQEDR